MADRTYLIVNKSWMLFVDGENFTKRGQVVLDEAHLKPTVDGPWRKDVFLWLPNARATHAFFSYTGSIGRPLGGGPPQPVAPPATRAYYYTSMAYESESEVTATRLALREIGFEPQMYRRRRDRSKVVDPPPGEERDEALARWKSKAVDLALATDVLTLAGEGRYEVAVIVAGDGDYIPVVEAVKRLGRHVVVAFFADKAHGLSDELRIAADEFVDLRPYLVSWWGRFLSERPEVGSPAEAAGEFVPE